MDFGSWNWVTKVEEPTFDIQSLFHPRRLEELRNPPQQEEYSELEHGDPKLRLQWSRCVGRFAALRAEISNCWDSHEQATEILSSMRKELHEHTNALLVLQPTNKIDPIPIKADEDATCKSKAHIQALEELNEALQSDNPMWLSSAIKLCRNVNVHENKLQPALKRLDKWEALRDGRSEQFVSFPESVEDNVKSARARSQLRRAMASREPKILKKAILDAESLLCSDEKIMMAARDELVVLEARKDASQAIQRALKSRDVNELRNAINLCVWSDFDDGMIAKARAALQTEMSQLAAREKLQEAMESKDIEVLACAIEETSNNLLDDPENELGEARKRLAVLKAARTLRDAAMRGDVVLFERAIEHASRVGVGASDINRAQRELSRLRMSTLLESDDPAQIIGALRRLNSDDSAAFTLRSRLAVLESKKALQEAIKSDDPIKIQNAIEQARQEVDDNDVDMIAAEAALDKIRQRMTSSMKEAMQNEDFDALEMLVEEAEIAKPIFLGNRTLFASKRRLSDRATQLSEARLAIRASLTGHDENALRQAVQLADAVHYEDHEVTICKNMLAREEKNRATVALREAIAGTTVAALEHALVIAEENAVDEELLVEGRRVLDERVANKARRATFTSYRDSVTPDGSPTAAKKAARSSAFSMGSFPFFPSWQPSTPAIDAQSPRESEASALQSAETLPGSRSSAAERARARIDAKDGLAKALENKDRDELDLAISHGREAGLTTRELQEAIDLVHELHHAASVKRRASEVLAQLGRASGAGDLPHLRTLIEQAQIEKSLTEFELAPFVEMERDMEAQVQAIERFREKETRAREVKSDIASMVVENPLRAEEMRVSLQNAEKLGLKGAEVDKARARLHKYKEVIADMQSNVSNADLGQLRASIEHARMDVGVSKEDMLPFENDLLRLESRNSIDVWAGNMQMALNFRPIDIAYVRELLEASPDSRHPLHARVEATLQAQTEINHALATSDMNELYDALNVGNNHKLDVQPIYDALSKLAQGQQLAQYGSLSDVDDFIQNSSLRDDHPVMRNLHKRRQALLKEKSVSMPRSKTGVVQDGRKRTEEREGTPLNRQTGASSEDALRLTATLSCEGGSVDNRTVRGTLAEQLDQLRKDSFMRSRVGDGGGGVVGEGKVGTESELHGEGTQYSGSLIRSLSLRHKSSITPTVSGEKGAPEMRSIVLPGFEDTPHNSADLSGGEDDEEGGFPSKISCPVCSCLNDATARVCILCESAIPELHARKGQNEREEDGGKDETKKSDGISVSFPTKTSTTPHIPQVPAITSDTAIPHGAAPASSEAIRTMTSPHQKSALATEQQPPVVSGQFADSPAKRLPVALTKSGENLSEELMTSTKPTGPPPPAFDASFPQAPSSKSAISTNQQRSPSSPDGESRPPASSFSASPAAPPPGTLERSRTSDIHRSSVSDVSVALETQQENAYKALCNAMRASTVNDVALNTAMLVARKLGLEKTDRGMRAMIEAEQAMVEWKRRKDFQDIIYSKDKTAIQKALKTAPNRDLAQEAEAMLENIDQEELQNALDELGDNGEAGGEEAPIAVAANQWQCPVCSLVNENSSHACVACDTPNPTAVSSTAPPGGTSRSPWECPTCTFQNQPQHRRCDACGTRNPARLTQQARALWTCAACTTQGNTGSQCGTCGSPPPGGSAAAPSGGSAAAPNAPARTDGVQSINWGPFTVNDRIKAVEKLKWDREGAPIPASRTGSFFKVQRGTMGCYVGTRNNQAMVEWNRKGQSPFLGAVVQTQVSVV
eukprot:GEMP01000436.1.p1 GENE.GEMP01000436.1~~GEMP01000436.1.p1  ORF type:complete len:1772 (-),score=500.76 GEMP01000436.1:1576-6891(-)